MWWTVTLLNTWQLHSLCPPLYQDQCQAAVPLVLRADKEWQLYSITGIKLEQESDLEPDWSWWRSRRERDSPSLRLSLCHIWGKQSQCQGWTMKLKCHCSHWFLYLTRYGITWCVLHCDEGFVHMHMTWHVSIACTGHAGLVPEQLFVFVGIVVSSNNDDCLLMHMWAPQ